MPKGAEVEPSEGQIEAFKIAWEAADARGETGHRVEAGLRAALNYQEPYGPEDAKHDFALRTMDEMHGPGTYAEVHRASQDVIVQRTIARWRDRLKG